MTSRNGHNENNTPLKWIREKFLKGRKEWRLSAAKSDLDLIY